MIYTGDSAADELAISRLKGVALTFRVINEDSTVITKTEADYRLEGNNLTERAQIENSYLFEPARFPGSEREQNVLHPKHFWDG